MRRERFSIVDSSLTVVTSGKAIFEARAALRPGQMLIPDAEAEAVL
jgi:hypothetical protein